jgi:hypothetical protein
MLLILSRLASDEIFANHGVKARNERMTPEQRKASATKVSKAAAKVRTRKAKERKNPPTKNNVN